MSELVDAAPPFPVHSKLWSSGPKSSAQCQSLGKPPRKRGKTWSQCADTAQSLCLGLSAQRPNVHPMPATQCAVEHAKTCPDVKVKVAQLFVNLVGHNHLRYHRHGHRLGKACPDLRLRLGTPIKMSPKPTQILQWIIIITILLLNAMIKTSHSLTPHIFRSDYILGSNLDEAPWKLLPSRVHCRQKMRRGYFWWWHWASRLGFEINERGDIFKWFSQQYRGCWQKHNRSRTAQVSVDPLIQCWFGSVRFIGAFQPIILSALCCGPSL